jgi:hypothetical protein
VGKTEGKINVMFCKSCTLKLNLKEQRRKRGSFTSPCILPIGQVRKDSKTDRDKEYGHNAYSPTGTVMRYM